MATIQEKAKNALQSATKPGTMAGYNSGTIEATLQPYADAIRKALPGGHNPNAIIQAAVFQISTKPELKECSVPSLIGAVLNTSLLGLNPMLDHCFFVARNVRNGDVWTKTCVFQIGYRGLIELAYRTGNVRQLFAEVVREGEHFEYTRGTTPGIIHRPKLDNDGKMIAAYAVIEFTNGGTQFVVFGKSEIEKRRIASSNQKNETEATGIWAQWPEEMWKKTVLRQLLKTTPLSNQVYSAMATDDKTVNIDDIKDGNVAGTTEAVGEDITEASDLQNIRDGVNDCHDLEALESYWNQGHEEWKNRPDIMAVFNNRKSELSK